MFDLTIYKNNGYGWDFNENHSGGWIKRKLDDNEKIAYYNNSDKLIILNNEEVKLSKQLFDDICNYLLIIENYLKGEHNHETDLIQQKEDFELYCEARRLLNTIEYS